jgi:hypothetical protein
LEAEKLDESGTTPFLEMLTSRMAHVERERESTPAKQYQGKPEQLKLNKTYLST